jgi:hypothetical protein
MENLVLERVINGGIQRGFKFENGFGASVVRHSFSYGGDRGLWELAVVKFRDEDWDSSSLTYMTDITDDVIGYLTWIEVEILLDKIKNLDEFGRIKD